MDTVISGSRRIKDPAIVEAAIRASGFTISKVIEGGQRTYVKGRIVGGVDWFARLWAMKHHLPYLAVRADWKQFGKAAGPIRNEQMASMAQQLIAIPAPDSRGTIDMIEAARSAGYSADRIYVHYDPDLFPEGPTGCLDDGDELSLALRELLKMKTY